MYTFQMAIICECYMAGLFYRSLLILALFFILTKIVYIFPETGLQKMVSSGSRWIFMARPCLPTLVDRSVVAAVIVLWFVAWRVWTTG